MVPEKSGNHCHLDEHFAEKVHALIIQADQGLLHMQWHGYFLDCNCRAIACETICRRKPSFLSFLYKMISIIKGSNLEREDLFSSQFVELCCLLFQPGRWSTGPSPRNDPVRAPVEIAQRDLGAYTLATIDVAIRGKAVCRCLEAKGHERGQPVKPF